MAFKYYKDANNIVYAYEADGSQDAFIAPGLTAITEDEANTIRFPPPTDEDNYNAERLAVEIKYSAPWSGTSGGILTLLQMTITSALAAGQDMSQLYTQYNAELAAMYVEFDTIDQKYGV